jgi:hypothetical protein
VTPAERAAYNESRIADHVKRAVAEAPELTTQQRTQLWELLRPIRERRGEALRSRARGDAR